MNLVTKSFSYTRLTLLCVEWVFLSVYALSYANNGSFSVSLEGALTVCAFLSALAGLSWIFPFKRPYWQKQGYIFLGILLITSAKLLAIDISFFLYLYIAKSCFLLNRKGILFTATITGMVYIISSVWSIPNIIKLEQSTAYNYYDPKTFTLSNLVTYLAASTFVILLSFAVIAEQTSRKRAEALAQQVETLAASLERTRIARDIHDCLGHTLTNLQMQLVVAQKFRQQNPAKTFQAIDTAKLLTDQCIEDVSHALCTIRSFDFDLNQALATLVEQIAQNQSLCIQWEINLPELPLQTRHHIYCIVKEGLINIQKHAYASAVRFQGQVTPNEMILELEDNGQGFDPHAQNLGYGLQGMGERVRALGGNLAIQSSPGQGTFIRVTIPR